MVIRIIILPVGATVSDFGRSVNMFSFHCKESQIRRNVRESSVTADVGNRLSESYV